MARALVLLAPGCEEMEAVIVIDVLRRAGVEVVAAGLAAEPIVASRGVKIVPDVALAAVSDELFDAIVLPGGAPGARALGADERVLDRLRAHHSAGRVCAAICAAPTVLARAGIVGGRRITSHPAVVAELRAAGFDVSEHEAVVVDGNVITSRAPGTAFEFAYALVERLVGAGKVAELESGILSRRSR